MDIRKGEVPHPCKGECKVWIVSCKGESFAPHVRYEYRKPSHVRYVREYSNLGKVKLRYSNSPGKYHTSPRDHRIDKKYMGLIM